MSIDYRLPPPPNPPKRSWFRRHPVLSVVIGIVVAIVVAAGIAGTVDDGEETAAPTPAPAAVITPDPTPDPTPAPIAVPVKLAATPEPTLDVERLVCDVRMEEIGENGGMLAGLLGLTGAYLESVDLEGAQRAYNEAAALKSQLDVEAIRWFGDCASLYDDATIASLDDAIYEADLAWANVVDICREELEVFGFDC